MWKYMVRTGHRIRCVLFACWITKAMDTHSEYVVYITFPWQQQLCECAWTLHYTCICFSVHLFRAYCMFSLSHASLFYLINKIWWRIHIRKLPLILQFYQSFIYTFSVWYSVLLPLISVPSNKVKFWDFLRILYQLEMPMCNSINDSHRSIIKQKLIWVLYMLGINYNSRELLYLFTP